MYREFLPVNDDNVWPSFLAFLKKKGYVVGLGEDYWTFLATHRATGHEVRVKPVSKVPGTKEMLQLAAVHPGDRVLVLDFKLSTLERESFSLDVIGGEGIGVLNGFMGWLNTPGNITSKGYKRLAVAFNPRYVRGDDGEFWKKCYKCEETKPTSEYYLKASSRKRETDPYRNMCKACFREGLDKGG